VQQLAATAALAVLDPLTGLPDRRGVQLVAARLLAIARRESGAVGCTFVRLEGYQDVLQTAGPTAADALVVHVAGVIGAVVRGTDVVARWSTSDFVVVAHGQGAPMDVLEGRIERLLGADCPVPESVWAPRLLLGRAVLEPWDEGGLATTLEAAERDMYLRAGLEPPRASLDAEAEAAAAHSLRAQAAHGEAVSEMITAVDGVLGEAARSVAPPPPPAAENDSDAGSD
jgi:diguanylate cyclase (GGDEF)-like protein